MGASGAQICDAAYRQPRQVGDLLPAGSVDRDRPPEEHLPAPDLARLWTRTGQAGRGTGYDV
jgi:hypothetical protein